MPKISRGNYLYFYQLFSTEIGTGRQDSPQRFEEVLTADGLDPQDVACESIEQLLEELDFVKLTVFKKGRVLVTVMARDDLNELLEKAANPAADKGGSGKSFKRGKKKDERPVKPRHQRKAEPAAKVEVEAEAEIAAEPQVEAVAEPEVETKAEKEAEQKAEAEIVAEPQQAEPVAQAEPEPEPEAKAEQKADSEVEAEPQAEAAAQPEPEPEAEAEPAEVEAEPKAEQKPEPEIAAGPQVEATTEQKAEVAQASAGKTKPKPEATSKPQVEPKLVRIHTTPKLKRIRRPEHFSQDVQANDNELRALYDLLPEDVSLGEALDNSWEEALQTDAVIGTHSELTFPLVHASAEGLPITVTICRAARQPSGKDWKLASVSCNDA